MLLAFFFVSIFFFFFFKHMAQMCLHVNRFKMCAECSHQNDRTCLAVLFSGGAAIKLNLIYLIALAEEEVVLQE